MIITGDYFKDKNANLYFSKILEINSEILENICLENIIDINDEDLLELLFKLT